MKKADTVNASNKEKNNDDKFKIHPELNDLASDTKDEDGKEKQDTVLKSQIEDWKNKYLRALADYRNLENRSLEEKNRIRKAAGYSLILKLLPFIDGLEKAEAFFKDQGLKLVKEDLLKSLQNEGLEEIDVLNKEYDPYTAEVIDLVNGEKDNVVVEVLRKGYRLNGEIIRVAQVKVSKKT